MKKTTITTMMTALMLTWAVTNAQAGFVNAAGDGCDGISEVLIGADNDNVNNSLIQPITPPPNQSLNNTDIINGKGGCDVLIGLQGNDVLLGGGGQDIMIGGTEQFDPDGFGNRDVVFGNGGSDTNIWAPGDGSDAFIGGTGSRDAQVFGVIDRDQDNVPILSDTNGRFHDTGMPTANVTGSPGFCRLERVDNTDIGFEFLVRFFVRAAGNLAVTIRLAEVEQVFCTSEEGGQIIFADLTDDNPHFRSVSQSEVRRLNSVVGEIIR